MKITKYILILILTLAFITPIMTNAKVNVDIQAAPQLSTKISFRAGVSVEIPLSDNLSLDPGLYFSMRHRWREESLKTTSQSGEILEVNSCELNAIANCLQLPFYISCNIPTRETDMQKVMFGPYFAYCLGGNSTITQRHDGAEIFSLTSPTYPTFLDSRFDFGVAIEYKYILKSHFIFGIYAEFGLKSVFNSIEVQKDDSPTEFYHMNPGTKNNQNIGLTLGYRF